MKRFELVVPAYNEAKNLELIIQRFCEAAGALKLNSEEVQLVVVNNGSRDDSAQVLEQLLQKSEVRQWVRPVDVPINQGYGYGVMTGLKSCTADIIGWTHADMQCDPKDALKAFLYLKNHQKDKTLVKGVRFGRSLKEVFVSRVFEFIASVLFFRLFYEINAQPKVFSRSLMAQLKSPPKDFAFDFYVLYQASKAGFSTYTIPVQFPPRLHGVSNWAGHFFSRYKTIFKMIFYLFKLRMSK